MKLDSINKVRVPNFIKNIMVAAPLVLAAPIANALVRTPEKDTFNNNVLLLCMIRLIYPLQ